MTIPSAFPSARPRPVVAPSQASVRLFRSVKDAIVGRCAVMR